MLIRKATEKDFEEYYKLYKAFFDFVNSYTINKELRIKLNKTKIKKEFNSIIKSKNSIILVCEKNNQLIAYLKGNISERNRSLDLEISKIGDLDSVFIDKKHRGQSLLRKLILEFEKYLKKNKIKYYNLSVSERNPSALDKYKHLGFKIEEHQLWKKVLK